MNTNRIKTHDFIAGSFSGMAGTFIGYPFDTIKVRMQTNNNINWKSLYKGLTFPLMGEVLNASLVFGIYGNIKDKIKLNGYKQNAISGFISGIMSAFVLCPLEMFKIKKQLGINNWCNPYRGISATVMRDAPFHVVYFTGYEYIKNQIKKKKQLDNGDYILAGGISGMLAWTSSYPFDMIKTKIQSGDIMKIKDALSTIYKTKGIRGLFKGYFPTILRAFPVNATCFLVYEHIMKFLNKNTQL